MANIRTLSRPWALIAGAALAGCTVGPDYDGPPRVAPVASASGRFVRAGDLGTVPAPTVANWWQALGDPVLDGLVTRALADNPDVAVAGARLRQARASLRQERANGAPSVSATAVYAHARLPPIDLAGTGTGTGTNGGTGSGGGANDINFYNLGFDASWEVDLFGGQRRAVEASRAGVEEAEANVTDAQVSLSAEVAAAYVNLRDRQRRILLNTRSAAMQERMLDLTRQRYDRGTASRLDVVRLQQQLSGTRADLTPLNAEVDSYLDQLAVLTGAEPGALDTMLRDVRPVPLPPAAIAIGDPATVLRHRPDIRAAERRLAASSARIGTAEAAKFPRLSFMGILGIGGTSPSQLTSLDDFTLIAAPQLSWSFLDFGRNAARVTQAEAARDEAAARYRGAVLTALRDAEDALSRFRYRRATVASLARAQQSAQEAARLSQQRYVAGTTTLIDLLDTQRQEIAADEGVSVAEAQLTGDFIAIQKALGLGWGGDAAGQAGTDAPR